MKCPKCGNKTECLYESSLGWLHYCTRCCWSGGKNDAGSR